MSVFKTKRLALITVVYWFLLMYIVAALVWWFISLQQQNERMTSLLLDELKQDDPAYTIKVLKIDVAKKRKTAQYIGEGATFLALIFVGAIFVYRATRRQLILSQQQQNFMMAVTHELKTPIAVARLNLETLQKHKLDEIQQQKLISNTLNETNRLNTLCNNILLASQLDSGSYKISKNEVCLSDMAVFTVKDFSKRFSNRKIQSNIQPDIYLNGEEALLQMLLNNLIENAIKYSANNTTISVSLVNSDEKIVCTVSDEGPGIADKEKLKVFDKFYRVGNEETRTAKGTGLGLYLCKKIANDHNAKITVTDNAPLGSNFIVTFKT